MTEKNNEMKQENSSVDDFDPEAFLADLEDAALEKTPAKPSAKSAPAKTTTGKIKLRPEVAAKRKQAREAAAAQQRLTARGLLVVSRATANPAQAHDPRVAIAANVPRAYDSRISALNKGKRR